MIATVEIMKRPTQIERDRATRIASARVRAGLTQAEVARSLDIEQSSVHRWERKCASPHEVIERLAKLYRTTPAWLMYGVGAEAAGDPPYQAWSAFKAWLNTAPEAALARPWMIDDMRAVRFSEGIEPTEETYRRLLFALMATKSAG